MAAPAWFPWYASDWLNDAQLRNCTKAQRGCWADILSLLHLQPQRGLWRASLAPLASLAGARLRDVRGLVEANVLRGSDGAITEPVIYQARHARKVGPVVMLIHPQPGPLWYSKRMVEDEYKRTGAVVLARGASPTPTHGASPTPTHGASPTPTHGASPTPTHGASPLARGREEGEGEGEIEKEIQGSVPAGAGPDPRAPARMCACEDDAQPEDILTLQQAAAILAAAGLQLQAHDPRVVELLRLGATGYELQQAAAKTARHAKGDWMRYLRATIEGMRDDHARPLAGVPVNGAAGAIPKDYHAMMDAAARELAEFEALKGQTQ